jgi:hypothetical protein
MSVVQIAFEASSRRIVDAEYWTYVKGPPREPEQIGLMKVLPVIGPPDQNGMITIGIESEFLDKLRKANIPFNIVS